MSSIAFAGLATGLDTAAIVSQLVEIRRRPIYRLETRRQGYQNEISALSLLKTKLLAFQTAAQNLDTASEFSSLIGSSADEDILRVTAGSGATPGSYNITVNSLAVAQKNISQGFDAKTDSVGSGTVSITINGVTTDLELTGFNSVESLANLINDNVEGVSASIIYDGSASGGYHLILTGDEAGGGNAFTVDASGLAGGVTPVFSLVTAAADAHLTIDDIDVTTSSNSPTDVISGLTLDLVAASTDPIRVEVKRDNEGIAENVKAFVDAYNDLASFYEDQRTSEGVLRRNATLRSVFTRIENIFTGSLEDGLGAYSSFTSIGITRGDGHKYDFDQGDFIEALNDNFGGVRDLLIEREGNVGKAALIDRAIEALTDSVDGLFKMSTELLNTKIDYADKSIERYERSIAAYKLTMERKYAAMEMMVSSLQAQGSYLNSMLFMDFRR